MMLKLSRIAVVSTAALTLAAATIPTKAEAFGFLLAPALLGSAFLGAVGSGGGYYGGGGGYYGGGCCQVYAPPPPPPCCVYGGGYGGGYGGDYGGGYGGGYGRGYGGGYGRGCGGGYGRGYGRYGGGYGSRYSLVDQKLAAVEISFLAPSQNASRPPGVSVIQSMISPTRPNSVPRPAADRNLSAW